MLPTPDRIPSRAAAVLAVLTTLAALVGLSAPAQAVTATETISGTVTSSAGERLAGIRVTIDTYDDAGSPSVEVTTSATGGYSAVVPRAEHGLCFQDTVTPARVRIDCKDLAAPTQAAPAGRTLSITLAAIVQPTATETVTGVVTSSVGGPLRGVRVTVDSFTDDDYRDDLGRLQTTTAANGSYTVTAPRSPHTVCFSDSQVPAGLRTRCESLLPTAPSPRRLDAVLSRIGSISGTVRDADGSMVSEGHVRAYRLTRDGRGGQSWTLAGKGTYVRAAGTYTITGLSDGTYRVCVSDEGSSGPVTAGCAGGPWVTDARDVSVAGGEQTADIALSRGTLHWSVSPETGGAFGNDGELSVHVYRRQPDSHGHPAWQRVVDLDEQLDDDSLLLPAGTYRVEVGTPGAVSGFYPAATSVDTATDVVVRTGQVTTLAQRLAAGGSITGTMTAAGGASYVGTVRAVNLATGEQTVQEAPVGGTYSLDGLRAGSYRVEFNRTSGYSPYVGQYYKAKPESAGEATATQVVVAKGAVTSRVDTTVAAAATITGTLLGPDGSALSADDGASVVAIGTGGPGGTETSRGTQDRVTGRFSIPGVSAGTYRLVVETGEGLSYYAGTSALGLAERTAAPVTVATSGTTALGDLRLPLAPTTLRSTTRPTIAGPAQTGELLSADPGAWSVPGASFDYQWLVDGTAVDGATGQTYRPAAADTGRRIAVVVTASLAGYRDGRAVADDTADIVQGLPAVQSSTGPVISGAALRGSPLSVSTGTWSPTPDGFSYAWLREGRVIPGADQSTYVPVDADIGRRLSARVTASAAAYVDGVVTTPPTAPVTSLALASAAAPTISGVAQWGSPLSVSSGRWSATPSALTYAWLRDGRAIPGADRSTYVPVDADIGRRLSARVTASAAAYDDGTVTTTSTVPVTGPVLTSAAAPSIAGALRYGSTLTADPSTWSPTGVTLAYQWYAGTTPIAGAIGRSYPIAASVVGRSLSVRVTASRVGSASVTRSSAATGVVAPAALKVTRNPSIRWAGRPGAVLAVKAGSVTPAPTVRYQWLRNGAPISRATRSTYRITRADRARYVSLRVSYAKVGYASLARVTNRVGVR